MPYVRFDRLSLHAPAHILQRMKKELYEIEREARRMRAQEMSRLLHAGATRIASLVKRVFANSSTEVRHA